MSDGLAAERRVARYLTERDFLVSSRRHFGGAGDLLAVQKQTVPRTWDPILVEVKATERGPFAGFPPADRLAMRNCAFEFNLEPLLAWVTRRGIFWLSEADWPE